MKRSGVEWIGEIPDEWNLVRLKDICINKKEIAGEKSSEYERLALTLNGVIKRPKDDQEGLQPKEFDTYQILEENDFVFKMIDLQNISTSRVGLSPYTGLVSPAYIRFASKKKGQFNEFIHYYLLSLWHNCVYNNIAGDGVRSALNATDMGNLKCPYPTEDQQRKITGFLNRKTEEIDSLIDIENQQIEKLKEYKQAIIFDTVTKGLDKSIRLKDSGVEWIGMIPNNWKIMRIKDAFVLNNERTDETDLKKVNLISLYTDQGVVQHSDLIETTGNRAITAEGYKIVRKKDMVVNIILCWMGAIGISEYNGVTSPAYDVYSPKEGVVSKYYHYLFRTNKFNGECFKYGRGIMLMRWRTYSTEFKSIFIPYPSLAEQEKIVEYLDIKCGDIDELISIKQKKIEKLYEYKKSLVYEYVTGKKEVIV